jgi:hypothetical protein
LLGFSDIFGLVFSLEDSSSLFEPFNDEFGSGEAKRKGVSSHGNGGLILDNLFDKLYPSLYKLNKYVGRDVGILFGVFCRSCPHLNVNYYNHVK